MPNRKAYNLQGKNMDLYNHQKTPGFQARGCVKSKYFSLFVGKDISLLFGKQKSLFLSHSENRK